MATRFLPPRCLSTYSNSRTGSACPLLTIKPCKLSSPTWLSSHCGEIISSLVGVSRNCTSPRKDLSVINKTSFFQMHHDVDLDSESITLQGAFSKLQGKTQVPGCPSHSSSSPLLPPGMERMKHESAPCSSTDFTCCGSQWDFRTGSSTSCVCTHSTMGISTLGHVNSCVKACGWAWLCRNWCNCMCGIHLHIYVSACPHQNICVHLLSLWSSMFVHVHEGTFMSVCLSTFPIWIYTLVCRRDSICTHTWTFMWSHKSLPACLFLCMYIHVPIQAIQFSACSWMKMHMNLYAYAAPHLPRHLPTYCVCAHRYVHFIFLRDKQEQGYWENLVLVSYEVIRAQFQACRRLTI